MDSYKIALYSILCTFVLKGQLILLNLDYNYTATIGIIIRMNDILFCKVLNKSFNMLNI
jgi:hypothetical protein